MPFIRRTLAAILVLATAHAAGSPPTAPVLQTVWTTLAVGQQGQYAARGVTDPDAGTTITYTFDWGDGTTTNVGPTTEFGSGNGVGPYHAWGTAGTYSVRARATDNQGNVSPWSNAVAVWVYVPDPSTPPTAPRLASVWSNLKLGEPGEYLATDATDPDFGTTLTYVFDWDDSTTSRVGPTSVFGIGQGVKTSHAWAAAGTYSVKVMVVDNGGNASPWSAPFTVYVANNAAPVQPVPPVGPSKGYAGFSYAFSAVTTDPNGDTLTYTFDWGDGTSSGTYYAASGAGVTASHAWTQTSDYSVRVRATDRYGLSSPWSEPARIRVVVNTAPTTPSAPTGPQRLSGGQVGTFGSAGSLDSTSTSVRYRFSFGDGTSYSSPWTSPGVPVNASHMWTLPGTFAVRLQAMDDGGMLSAWSAPFYVTIASKLIAPPPSGDPVVVDP